MPFKNDVQKGGTNIDGSLNSIYCSYYYKNSDFTFKGTSKEMQVFCKEKMIEQDSSKLIDWTLQQKNTKAGIWYMQINVLGTRSLHLIF
tara:strand:- start:17557 stop:17823 length:267 start_codon:yes stop_codon:yes gene_type:complete